MKAGQQLEVALSYSNLYKLNPEIARTVVIEISSFSVKNFDILILDKNDLNP